MTTVEPTDALPRRRVLWIGGAIVLMFLVLGAVVYATGPTTPDETDNWWAYLSVFLLVTADGVCPVFPGETTLNAASTPKKKMASMPVMIMTMMPVVTVSLRVGQETLSMPSNRTWRINSPGVVFATGLLPLSDRKTRSAEPSAGPRLALM